MYQHLTLCTLRNYCCCPDTPLPVPDSVLTDVPLLSENMPPVNNTNDVLYVNLLSDEMDDEICDNAYSLFE